MVSPDNQELIQLAASEVIEPWRQALPNFPWSAVEQLTVAVIFKHPQILLLTNDQAKKILEEEEITYPPQFSASDIAGRTNPALVDTRTALK